MDLQETMRILRLQKERIERAIAALEEYLEEGREDLPPLANRRGRKAMPLEERREVSERMKRYWAKRQKQTPE